MRQRRLAAAAVALAVISFLWAFAQPLAGDGEGRVRVVVPKASSAGEIGDLLAERGVVESGSLFQLRATLAGERDSLKPGIYYLGEEMSYGDAIDRLVAGPGTELITVTIPEGLSRAETAPLVRRAGVRGNYLAASRSSPLLDPRRYGAGERLDSLEGFLFPATYELRARAQAQALVERQVEAFRERFAQVDLSYAKRKNLTAFDVLTIASMVEREAQVDGERNLIAAVVYNRLREGQPLAIDATVRFATGNWTSPLKQSELAVDSPYNTRMRAGLPPGPIGSPGLASIEAAARPARVPYLYYVVKPGTCGEHEFSSSFDQFERDRRRYEQAREAAGGRSPTKCP